MCVSRPVIRSPANTLWNVSTPRLVGHVGRGRASRSRSVHTAVFPLPSQNVPSCRVARMRKRVKSVKRGAESADCQQAAASDELLLLRCCCSMKRHANTNDECSRMLLVVSVVNNGLGSRTGSIGYFKFRILGQIKADLSKSKGLALFTTTRERHPRIVCFIDLLLICVPTPPSTIPPLALYHPHSARGHRPNVTPRRSKRGGGGRGRGR